MAKRAPAPPLLPREDATQGLPDVVGWETTLACNMRCRHCGSTAGDARHQELSTEQAMALCQQVIELGAPRVCLTGGETLLRRDWQTIVDTLLAANIEVGLLTNGWVLTERVIRQLQKYVATPVGIAVSLDGPPAVHDEIRQLPGSFRRALDGAKALLDSGVWVDVITTINPANLDHLAKLRNQVLERLRPMSWQIQVTTPFGRARDHDDMTLDQVSYTRAACFISETRHMAADRSTVVFAGDCVGYFSSIEPGLRGGAQWPGCSAGTRVVGVRSNGDVIGCLSIIDDALIEGNVLETPLKQIWERKAAFSYTRDFDPAQLTGGCAHCEVGAQCRGGCTANSIAVASKAHESPYCLRRLEIACGLHDEDKSEPVRNIG